jgi:3,4-dihydroxy 2-butanone 4-phosphate synthase/GTP cyclohydrolase II
MSEFHSIEEALEDIKAGKMVIAIDDEDRENEGDFIMAAEKVTAEDINYMTIHGRGLICTPITEERAKALDLDLMVKSNSCVHETAFTVSVDSIYAGTGISAQDRACTIKAIIDEKTKPEELLRPGHIFPLIAKKGGVLQRPGHTEAAIDLARLAGLDPSGVICEIMTENGEMARTDELISLAKKLDLKIITIKDLIKYRESKEEFIVETSKIPFPNKFGNFDLHLFESLVNIDEYHMAFVKGEVDDGSPVLVRIHSECFTGDVLGSFRCDCGDQLRLAMEKIEEEGRGILVYMRQEGRGIGLPSKIRAYSLQDKGFDTVTANHELGYGADQREYGFAANILKKLGVRRVNLLTNNPKKVEGLEDFDIEIVRRIALEVSPNQVNQHYLETKRDKLGHLMNHLH